MSEIARAWQGALRLAHADPAGLTFFDDSVEGFWRSFRAAAIVAPGHVIFMALNYDAEPPAASWTSVVLIELAAYAVGWLAFPVAMHAVCRAIGREALFLRYITVYNWSNLLQMAFFLSAMLIGVSGILGAAGGFLVAVAAVVVLLYYWLIARIALQIGPLSAAAVVLLDFALGQINIGIVDWMTH